MHCASSGCAVLLLLELVWFSRLKQYYQIVDGWTARQALAGCEGAESAGYLIGQSESTHYIGCCNGVVGDVVRWTLGD